MNAIEALLLVARTYAEAERLELTTVSWRALGDTKKLHALQAGRDIQVKRCDAALQWFSDHWPVEAEWPQVIARPFPSPPSRGAAALNDDLQGAA